eukprot:PITA_04915
MIYLVVYVDDLSMTWNNENYIASTRKELKKGFEITDLGYVHYYLGIEVTRHPKFIFLSQRMYIGDLLNMFDITDCNPLTTMEQNLKLTSFKGKEFEVATKYRKVVGSLNYLTTTRSRYFVRCWNPLQVYARAFLNQAFKAHWNDTIVTSFLRNLPETLVVATLVLPTVVTRFIVGSKDMDEADKSAGSHPHEVNRPLHCTVLGLGPFTAPR